MNQMNKTMIAAIGILIASLTNGVQAQMPEIPAELKQMVSKALQASETAMVGERKLRAAAQQEYEATMAQIADTFDPKLAEELKAYEGESIEAKVITIADYKKKNPAMHENVIESYFTRYVSKEAINKFGRSPDVRSVFKEEEYRLVWEYYALACNLEDKPTLADRRPIEALGIIGNPKSMIVLQTVLNPLINSEVLKDKKMDSRMGTTLSAMLKLNPSIAFEPVITAMKEIDKLGYTIGIGGEDRDIYYLYAETVFHHMTAEQLAKWKQAAESYSKDKLDQQQQEFLGNIFAAATQ